MLDIKKEIIIKNELEEIVACINVKDNVLHGRCEWYDGMRDIIACGIFQNGAPFTGTFLNWAIFFKQINEDRPYDVAAYCQDWITAFEVCFASELPNYEMLIEAYYKGKKISS